MTPWLDKLDGIQWQALAVGWGVRIVAALLIFLIGLSVARWLSRIAERGLTRADVEPTAVQFLRKLAYVILLVLLLLTALSVVGVPMTSMIAVLGAAGLAIGLALKDSLANIASGVMLVTLKPFKVGDIVNIGNEGGTVESVSIFQTCLRGADNQRIVLPNSLITAASIINLTPDTTRRVELVVGIGYGDDIALARETALSILHADARILDEPAPDVVVYELAESTVQLGIRCRVRNADHFAVRCDLNERIKAAFDRAGISFPFPQRDVHLIQAPDRKNAAPGHEHRN
jgi:small conductance mechanosensitive channel